MKSSLELIFCLILEIPLILSLSDIVSNQAHAQLFVLTDEKEEEEGRIRGLRERKGGKKEGK